MPAIFEQYTNELEDKFGYLATWLPSTALRLGDVGILKRARFEFVTTAAELGLQTEVRDHGGAADYQYVSAAGADIAFSGGANANTAVLPSGVAGSTKLSVRFSRANAIVFVAAGCRTTLIGRQDQLGRQILERWRAGNWPDNHVVITELITAESATILISATEEAHIDLSAKGHVVPAGLSLADASAGFQVTGSSGVATQILAAQKLTPLFRASGVRKRFLNDPSFETRGENVSRTNAGHELVFADVGYDTTE